MSSEEEKRAHRCCFIGQRFEKLSAGEDTVRAWLNSQLELAISQGYVTFITGMSMGADILAGEIIAGMRDSGAPLHLIAAVPYHGFEKRWHDDVQARYHALLKRADLVKYVSPGYTAEAFTLRNRWMLEHSSLVIAVHSGMPGTALDAIKLAADLKIETRSMHFIP